MLWLCTRPNFGRYCFSIHLGSDICNNQICLCAYSTPLVVPISESRIPRSPHRDKHAVMESGILFTTYHHQWKPSPVTLITFMIVPLHGYLWFIVLLISCLYFPVQSRIFWLSFFVCFLRASYCNIQYSSILSTLSLFYLKSCSWHHSSLRIHFLHRSAKNVHISAIYPQERRLLQKLGRFALLWNHMR